MRLAQRSVASVFFSNGFLYASYISRLPAIQSEYNLDYQGVGLILLCGAIGSLVAMPFTGGLIGLSGSKRVTLTAAFFFCLSIGGFMLAPGVILLATLFFLKGIAAGITDVAMNAQAVLVERQIERPVMTAFHGIFSIGMFAGAGAGALFIAAEVEVLHHMFIISLLCIILVFSHYKHFLSRKYDPPVPERARFINTPHPRIIGIGLIAFCGMLAEGAMADWSTNFMEKVMQAGAFLSPTGLAAFSLAMVIGRFAGDRARMFFGDARLISIASVMAISGLLLIISGLHFIPVVLGFFLSGTGLSVVVPIVYSQAGNTPGIDPGTGISMATTIGYSGFIIGPPVIGYLADWKGLQVAYGLVLLLLLMMYFINRAIVQQSQEP